MAAIPTTAGTGSEVGRGTLIQLPQTSRKTAVLSPHLLPSVAICDPELTIGLSPALTAGTGMDAFTHCIESYLSTTFHPICDGIAVEGLRYISKGLETAVRDPANSEARTAMMMGALLGGISFHKGLGVVHSLSHALGATGRVHHGTLNAILLPHALRFNREAAGSRMADLGAAGAGARRRCSRASDHAHRTGAGTDADSPPVGAARRAQARADRGICEDRDARPLPCDQPADLTQSDMEELLERAW